MTPEQFLEAYQKLCTEAGLEIQPVEQRQVVDGVWVVKAPSIAVVAIAPERLAVLREQYPPEQSKEDSSI